MVDLLVAEVTGQPLGSDAAVPALLDTMLLFLLRAWLTGTLFIILRRVQFSQTCVRFEQRRPPEQAAPNGGTVRVLLAFLITQRHALDRRSLEAVLRLVRCGWSAGGFADRVTRSSS